MKKEKILITLLICIICILMVPTISNAGLQIIKDGEVWKSITVSESYKICRDLAKNDSTLGNNSLDPHLALNKDWGAVAYLSISNYGTAKSGTTTSITVGGVGYTTTNGNMSGVINLGKTYTQTAGIREDDDGSTYASARETLTNNKGTKYVETLSSTNSAQTTLGQSIGEVTAWSGSGYPSTKYPVSIRSNLTKLYIDTGGSYVYHYSAGGGAYTSVTFRPAIWN